MISVMPVTALMMKITRAPCEQGELLRRMQKYDNLWNRCGSNGCLFIRKESGIDLAQELRKSGYRGLIIGMSAGSRYRDGGIFDKTILKPLSLESLNTLMTQMKGTKWFGLDDVVYDELRGRKTRRLSRPV